MRLTTDHPSSSYGLPVLIVDGEAYAPAERLPDGTLAACAEISEGREHIDAWESIARRWQLREAATLAGLSGCQAAKLLHVDPRTWRRWVGGERQCPWMAYYALLSLTGQDTHDVDSW